MQEVEEIKKAISVQHKQRTELQKRINQAIETVDNDRKAKRDESNRPN